MEAKSTVFLQAFVILIASAMFGASHAAEQKIHGDITVDAPINLKIPVNEQPYFGFQSKNSEQKDADSQFLAAISRRHGAINQILQRAWAGIENGDFSLAAKRFNQAYLLQPSHAQIAHGFAIIAAERIKDAAYAEQLFKAAARLASPLPTLPADHARFLLQQERFSEAVPLLERSVKMTPEWAVPRANLAFAYFKTGHHQKACDFIKNVPEVGIDSVRDQITWLRSNAGCR